MIRLYCGLAKDGKLYNYTEIQPVEGGALAVMEGSDKSGTAKLLNLVKHAVKKLYTVDKECIELSEEDYLKLKVDDGWKISLEVIKQFTGQEYPSFKEHFYCKVCSSPGMERYTETNESWHKLIEKGIIDENYIDKVEDFRFETELPFPVEIPAMGSKFAGCKILKVVREKLNFEEMLEIVHTPGIEDDETKMVYATWDMEIKEIPGMGEKEINLYVKRDLTDSFTRKYFTSHKIHEAMEETTQDIGLDYTGRKVRCKKCNAQIGGYLDFTNFFEFLFPKKNKSTPKGLG